MSHRERHDDSPFLDHPPVSPWRARIKEFRRRPLLTKQIACLAIVFAIAMPIWLFMFRGQERAYTSNALEDPHYPATTIHWAKPEITPPASASPSFVEYIESSKVPTRPHNSIPSPIPIPVMNNTLDAIPDPPTFSFIMFSEDSASEGAVLMKVRWLSSLVRLGLKARRYSPSYCTRPAPFTSILYVTKTRNGTLRSGCRWSSDRCITSLYASID